MFKEFKSDFLIMLVCDADFNYLLQSKALLTFEFIGTSSANSFNSSTVVCLPSVMYLRLYYSRNIHKALEPCVCRG